MLSILIPSIPRRAKELHELVWTLNNQWVKCRELYPMLGDIETLVDDSKAVMNGGISIGEKRGGLVSRVVGEYLCFLDDDDTPSPNYVESLLRLCQSSPDVVTFRAAARLTDYWALVDMRLAYLVNDQLTPEHTVRRPPWHICPVRAEYAKMYPFSPINNAEDFDWMAKVLAHCTTEAHTDKILFQYNHNEGSEADRIEHLTSDVGARIENPSLRDSEIILPL